MRKPLEIHQNHQKGVLINKLNLSASRVLNTWRRKSVRETVLFCEQHRYIITYLEETDIRFFKRAFPSSARKPVSFGELCTVYGD